MKKNKTKTRKIKSIDDENYRPNILSDIFKFFNRMQDKYKDDSGYIEFLALCCLIDFFKDVQGKKVTRQLFNDRLNL